MSNPHTVRVVTAEPEIHSRPSKRSALTFAYETHRSRGVTVEVYEGDYVADRRVVDTEPVLVLK